MANPEVNDLVIVGSGPAGLSAAVSAASEGLRTLVIDGGNKLGGQAAESTKIENYAGFRDGVSGKDLTFAMVDQAIRFGADIQAPLQAEGIEVGESIMEIRDDGVESIAARAILMCCGVQYRRHPARNMAGFLRRGVSYGSPDQSAKYSGKKIFVVGGANSAGQAAMHLSQFEDCNIDLLVRGADMRAKMSAYLANRIEAASNITVHTETAITEAHGDGRLEAITVDRAGETERLEADRLFLLIGAIPKTKWVPEKVARDDHGFIQAGSDIPQEVRKQFVDEHGRPPYAHETCIPGLFVAGDVRSQSVKRVAGAAGDGAGVVSELHQYIAGLRER